MTWQLSQSQHFSANLSSCSSLCGACAGLATPPAWGYRPQVVSSQLHLLQMMVVGPRLGF